MYKTILERINNIDYKSTKIITIIISIALVLFAIIYIWKINENNKEGFAQYNVTSNDLVTLADLNNVVVGGNDTNLTTAITNLISAYNSNTINNTFAKITDINNINTILTDTTKTINNIRTQLDTLTSKQSTDINTINQSLTSNINLTPPPLSIIAFYGIIAPLGWQLCDGRILIAVDNTKVLNSDGSDFITPDLKNKFIAGAGSTYTLGQSGGQDSVILTTWQIPSHNHALYYGTNGTASGIRGWQGVSNLSGHSITDGITSAGGNQPHENRPPFIALTYIIKKPITGGIFTR